MPLSAGQEGGSQQSAVSPTPTAPTGNWLRGLAGFENPLAFGIPWPTPEAFVGMSGRGWSWQDFPRGDVGRADYSPGHPFHWATRCCFNENFSQTEPCITKQQYMKQHWVNLHLLASILEASILKLWILFHNSAGYATVLYFCNSSEFYLPGLVKSI